MVRREVKMSQVSTTEVGEGLGSVLQRAGRGERVVVTQRGRRVAAVVSLHDLELLERLEDTLDLGEAREALADPERIDWEAAKRRLGL